MHALDLLPFALALFGFGLVSGRLRATYVTPPMAFLLLGLLVGPSVTGLSAVALDDRLVAAVAELTLALMLFVDASTIDVVALARESRRPVRMLVLGLPLSILIGGGLATVLLPELALWPAFLLAALLAPTDMALGQVVAESEDVPPDVRRTVEVESGLNDGLALPAVLALSGLASVGRVDTELGLPLFLTLQLVVGPLVGVVLGRYGGRLAERSARAGWMTAEWERLTGVGLAIGSFALAGCLHGNGFVAAFVAGLAFRVRDRELRARIRSYGGTHADQLALILFMVFGATSLPAAALDARAWAYALASLFLVRSAAIALALLGTGTDRRTTLFLGWFGPRGLASILFATVVMEASGFVELERVLGVVRLTVGLSIVLHGLSAIPLSRRLARTTGPAAV